MPAHRFVGCLPLPKATIYLFMLFIEAQIVHIANEASCSELNNIVEIVLGLRAIAASRTPLWLASGWMSGSASFQSANLRNGCGWQP
jgi:hypothetical protein